MTWVVSLSGEPGKGPWDSATTSPDHADGTPAVTISDAWRWESAELAGSVASSYRMCDHENARPFPWDDEVFAYVMLEGEP